MFECHVRFERIFASKILTWAVAVTSRIPGNRIKVIGKGFPFGVYFLTVTQNGSFSIVFGAVTLFRKFDLCSKGPFDLIEFFHEYLKIFQKLRYSRLI